MDPKADGCIGTLGAQNLRGRRLLGRPSVRVAARAFALSRLVVLVLFFAAARLPGFAAHRPELATIVTQGDAGWYLHIARDGYEVRPYEQTQQHDWAFFPGWPLLWRTAALLTKEYPLTGAALATGLLFAALILLYEAAAALGVDESSAARAVLYTALWPTSLFFSIPTTESLFLLLTVGALLAGARDAWVLAGVLGAAAGATRPNGILLAPVLAVLYWRQHGGRLRLDALGIVLVPLGLLAFMVFLHVTTGNAFASMQIQVRWGRSGSFPLYPLWRWLRSPHVADGWNFEALNAVAGALGLGAAIHFVRRRSWTLASYALLGMIMPLSTRSLQSLTRFVMVLAPIPIALGDAGGSRGRHEAVLSVLCVLLGVVTTLFVGGYHYALT